MAIVEAEHLHKSFGAHHAVRDLSFSVAEGGIVGFLGPNGAGKTTTLRILAGFLEPTLGSVRVGGFDVQRERHRAQSLIGYMPEAPSSYREMRVSEYLLFRARLKVRGREEQRKEVARVIEETGLAQRPHAIIGQLSKGFRQRVGLADALLGRPKLVILDEPTAGLDPNQIREVRSLIGELRGRQTVLLSTHILSEVEMVCDRVLVIHRGRVVLDGRLEELGHQEAEGRAVLVLGGTDATLPAALMTSVLARRVGDGRTELELALLANEPLSAVVEACVQAGQRVLEARPHRSRLEDVFSKLTQGDAAI